MTRREAKGPVGCRFSVCKIAHKGFLCSGLTMTSLQTQSLSFRTLPTGAFL